MTSNKIWIAKSPSKYAEASDITFLPADPNDASDIINKIFYPVKGNEFLTVIPFNAPQMDKRKTRDLSFKGCVQSIDLEFDKCPKDFQMERNKFLVNKIPTPFIEIDSGNKSFHLVLFFKRFANSNDEYKRKCMEFVTYLSCQFPEYFREKKDEKKHSALVPDYSMFTGNRYFRQPNGIRKNGTVQTAKLLNKIQDGFKPQDLEALIGKELVLNRYYESKNIPNIFVGKRDIRKSTLKFIAMGVAHGERDNECYRAACDIKDCGYTKEEAKTILLGGAEKCNPPFPEEEVKRKVDSAWNGDGYYNPVDPNRPFSFIERSSGSYWYLLNGKLYFAPKDILKETFISYSEELPKPYPVLEFKFDPHDNRQIDLGNHSYNLFKPTHYHLMNYNGEDYDP